MAFLGLTSEKLALSLPELLGEFRVTLLGSLGVHVEGHRGLVRMTEDEMIFRCKKRVVIVNGEGLKLTELTDTDAYVKGKIASVLVEE